MADIFPTCRLCQQRVLCAGRLALAPNPVMALREAQADRCTEALREIPYKSNTGLARPVAGPIGDFSKVLGWKNEDISQPKYQNTEWMECRGHGQPRYDRPSLILARSSGHADHALTTSSRRCAWSGGCRETSTSGPKSGMMKPTSAMRNRASSRRCPSAAHARFSQRSKCLRSSQVACLPTTQ